MANDANVRKPSALPSRDPIAAPTLKDAAKVAGWGLVFWGAVQFATIVFARNATAAVAVQAALAEWGAGRLAIAWSDPLAPIPSWQQIARRVGRGAALGGGVACLVVATALVTHVAQVAERSLGVGLLSIGLVVSLLTAARDELLFRGVVLRATRGLLPCVGVARRVRRRGGRSAIRAEGTLGVGSSSRGCVAWPSAACGSATAEHGWRSARARPGLGLQSVVHGGLLDVRFAGEGDGGIPGLAVLGAAAVAAVAIAVGRPARPPRTPRRQMNFMGANAPLSRSGSSAESVPPGGAATTDRTHDRAAAHPGGAVRRCRRRVERETSRRRTSSSTSTAGSELLQENRVLEAKEELESR